MENVFRDSKELQILTNNGKTVKSPFVSEEVRKDYVVKRLCETVGAYLSENYEKLPIQIKEIDKGETVETEISLILISKETLSKLTKQANLQLLIDGEEV